MKKISKALIVFLFALGFTSCEDSYDIVQKGELNDEATFRTVGDLQLFLNGVYGNVEVYNQFFLSAALTDELGIGESNGGNDRVLHRFQFTVNDGYAGGAWRGNHALVNRVNRLLRGAELITVNDASEEALKQSIIAQARALRAFAYLQLSTYFSPDMTNNNALSGIVFDNVPSIGDVAPRSTNADVQAFIEADLAFAENNLIAPTGTNAYKFVTVDMINALRARYYLYRGNHVLARQYAQEVIDNSGLILTPALPYNAANFYAANSTNPYRRMWNDSQRGESIFSLDRPSVGGGSALASMFYFNATNITGSIKFDMGRGLYNQLASVAGDIRTLAFVDPTAIITNYPDDADPISDDQLPIDKYPGKTNAPLRNDAKVFRLSEMVLILAECDIVDGNLPGAAARVKQIRDARNRLGVQPLPVYGSPQAAWADVLLERRKELCYEGHRYIDLKRLGQLAGQGIDRDEYDLDAPGALSIPVNDYRFTFPVPLSELLGNPTIVQNPQY
jgi:starch-binding outer membrane protein, SusD/RagB family